jgi:hypothetical protein
VTSSELDRLEDLLPLYVTGRTNAQDQAFVEGILEQGGEAKSMLALHQAMAEGVRERIRLAGRSANLAGTGMGPRRRPESAPPRGQAARPADLPPGRSGLGGWRAAWPALQGRVSRHSLMAAMAVVMFAQTGFMAWSGLGTTDREAGQIKSGIVTEVNTLRVTFAPWATEARIRATLVGAGARILGGPTQLGEYWLASSTYSLEELRALLQSSGLVVTIEIDRAGPQGQ